MYLLNCAMINDAQALQYPKGLYDSPKNHINLAWIDLCGANIVRALEYFCEIKWFI